MQAESSSSQVRQVILLCAFALFSYLAFYGVGVLLAQVLLPADYGNYCAAVALTNILTVFSTLGLEKYSVKTIPAYLAQERFNLASGFWRFSFVVVAVVSTVLAVGIFGFHEFMARFRGVVHQPIAWLVLFLPIMAVTRHGIEFLTAYKRHIPSMLIYSGLLPLATLVIMRLTLQNLGHDMTSSHAVVVVGVAWVVSLLTVMPMVHRHTPVQMREAEPSYLRREWITGSLGFLAIALILVTLGNSILLVLEAIHSNEDSVGIFGAVVQTSNFVVLMAISTNRLYLPRLSELIAEGRVEGVSALLRDRMRVIGPFLMVFGFAVFFFGEQILDLFRHHTHNVTHAGHLGPYAERGYWALVVMAAAKIVSTWLAPAPFHLMYLGRTRLVVGTLGAASLVAVASAVPLARQWNELGAAVAYAVPITLAFLGMHLMARRKSV